MRRAALLLAFLASFSPLLGSQQPPPKPLTNSDIVRLIKAGVPEGTIALAIEQGPTDFDTSPAALIELKNSAVPQSVMDAMLRAKSDEPASASTISAATALGASASGPPLPKGLEGADLLAEGIYYKSAGGWVKLQQLTMAGGGAAHVGKMFVPGLTPQMVLTYRGAEAPVQIVDVKPTFLVKQSPYVTNIAGMSQRDLVMVQFNKKKDHRELQTTSGGNVFTFKAGFSKEKMPEITVNRVSETMFTVTPNSNLAPGEYLLTYGGFGAQGYDFGIKKPSN